MNARDELLNMSREDIHGETAKRWAERAVAAYELAELSDEDVLTWVVDAAEYASEAIEHAALSNDMALLASIRRAVETARKRVY